MRDFEDYLAAIQAHLSVPGRRSQEIVAELRTHLQARAADLRNAGMDSGQAVDEAVRGFGDPTTLARRLAEANGGQGPVGPLRTLLSLLIAFAGLFIAFSLVEGEPELLQRIDRAAAARSFLRPHDLGILAMILLCTPVAPLAGLLAGRRWWLAATPPVVWGITLWGVILAELIRKGLPLPKWALTTEGPYSLMLVFIAGPLLAALGWVGFRAAARRGQAATVGGVGVIYLVGFGLLSLLRQVHDLVGLLAIAGVAGLIVAVLGAALLWQKGDRWRRTALPGLGVCLVLLALMIASITADADQKVWIWLVVILTEMAMLAVAAGLSRTLTARMSRSTSTQDPGEQS